MEAREFMTPLVEAVLAHLPVREAARQMAEHNVGSLLVCDTERLVGVITDRDIVLRVVARGLDAQDTKVRDVMTAKPVFCREDDDVRDVARTMAAKRIRRIPVMSRKNGIVGVISLSDLARAREGAGLVGEVLESAAAKRV